MPNFTALLQAVIVSLAFQLCSAFACAEREITGYAYEPDRKILKYTELHYLANSQHTVVYAENDGKVFSKKKIDYEHKSFQPSVYQINMRTGEEIKIVNLNDQQLRIHYRKNRDARVKEKQIPLHENLVIDAGFDPYIQSNWLKLMMSEQLYFNFLVPSRLTSIKLKVQIESCAHKDRVCLSIRGANPLTRLFAKPIYLEYEKKSKQLRRFSGKSNIVNKHGKHETVDIHYFADNNQ